MSASIEQRVAVLENKVDQLSRTIAPELIAREGWESTVGMFAEDPGFEEMVRLGAQYRDSLRPKLDAPDSGH